MRQANILVEKDGAVRIAGLGDASILSHAMTRVVEGGTHTDRLPRHTPRFTWLRKSPNLTDSTHPTKAGDMYAFGVVAWEVRTDSFVRKYSVSSLGIGSHGATALLRDGRGRGNVLDAERDEATATGPPRNLGPSVVHDRTVLAQHTLKAHVSWRGGQPLGNGITTHI